MKHIITYTALLTTLLTSGCIVKVQPTTEQRIYVFKYDGSRQCKKGSISLAQMEKELTQNGISVFERCKSSSGIPVPRVCGHKTGRTNVFAINQSDYQQAIKLGFKKPIKPPKVCVEQKQRPRPDKLRFLKKDKN